MSESIIITVLTENSVHAGGLGAEHGLAFHLQVGSKSLLFDTGQSGLLARNAGRLGIDLSRLDAIALSHGHYDHTSGLGAVWQLARAARLYAHPAALAPHFVRDPDGSIRDIGIREESLAAIRKQAEPPCHTGTPTEVLAGVYLTGEIARETSYEDVGGPFVLDAAGTQPDALPDDQALFLDTREGVVVLLGCAHAGVVNTLRQVRRLTRERPIHAVLGGMHLLHASAGRLARTVEALRELGVSRLGPGHCTGTVATARLWHEFPAACASCSVGSRFVFQR